MTTQERDELLRGVAGALPDVSMSALAVAFGLSRSRASQVIGARPRRERPAPPATAGNGHAATVLPNRLRGFREARGWSQHAASTWLGVSKDLWNRWETGRTGCGLASVVLLCLDLYEANEGKP